MSGFFAGSVPKSAVAALTRESTSAGRGYLFDLAEDELSEHTFDRPPLVRAPPTRSTSPRHTGDVPVELVVGSLWSHRTANSHDAVQRALSSVRTARSPHRVTFSAVTVAEQTDVTQDISAIAAMSDSHTSTPEVANVPHDVAQLEQELAAERRRRFEAEVRLFRTTASKSEPERWVPRRSVFSSRQELVEVEAEDRAMIVAQEVLALDAIVLGLLRAAQRTAQSTL
uniref:Uncharacterized protein n=1 Tax=Neobodo designis TaxID=312471 RepID=A0A7S1R3F3_NEODS